MALIIGNTMQTKYAIILIGMSLIKVHLFFKVHRLFYTSYFHTEKLCNSWLVLLNRNTQTQGDFFFREWFCNSEDVKRFSLAFSLPIYFDHGG